MVKVPRALALGIFRVKPLDVCIALFFDGQFVVNGMGTISGSCNFSDGIDLCLTSDFACELNITFGGYNFDIQSGQIWIVIQRCMDVQRYLAVCNVVY